MTIASPSPVRNPAAVKAVPTLPVGQQMALYDAIARADSTTALELAEAVNVSEQFAASWLWTQRIIGFVDYNPDSRRFSLWCEWPRRG
jgi:hypothetical protein